MHNAIQDVFVSSRKSFMNKGTNCTKDVMHKYSPEFKFALFCQIFFLLPICINTLYSMSLNIHLKSASQFKQYSEGTHKVVTRKLQVSFIQSKYDTKYKLCP